MSKGGGQTKTQSKVTIPDAFKPLVFGGGGNGFGGILPAAQSLYGKGQLTATPTQSDATQKALAGGMATANQLKSSLLPQLMSAFSSYGNGVNSIANDATAGLQRQLHRKTLPSIGQGAIAAGQFGSSRQGIAEGLATAEAQRNIAEVRNRIFQQGRAQQLGFAPTLTSLMNVPNQLQGQVGAAQDAFHTQQTTQGFQNLLRLSQLVQGFIPGANQTQIRTKPQASPLTTLLGAGLAIGGMGATGGGSLMGSLFSKMGQ